jgi:hypothetical protein
VTRWHTKCPLWLRVLTNDKASSTMRHIPQLLDMQANNDCARWASCSSCMYTVCAAELARHCQHVCWPHFETWTICCPSHYPDTIIGACTQSNSIAAVARMLRTTNEFNIHTDWTWPPSNSPAKHVGAVHSNPPRCCLPVAIPYAGLCVNQRPEKLSEHCYWQLLFMHPYQSQTCSCLLAATRTDPVPGPHGSWPHLQQPAGSNPARTVHHVATAIHHCCFTA